MDVERLAQELRVEIRALELERVRIEERLAEKQRTLSRLEGVHSVNAGDPQAPGPALLHARKSITALGPHHYEVGTFRFENSGQLLDHFNAPHYFSKKNRGKDAAAREILRWAKQNPLQAQTVEVVLHNGTRLGLYEASNQVAP